MQGAGCLGLVHWDDTEGWCVGGKWERGSGLGTHVHPWQIHVDVWQNQYSIIEQNNNNKNSVTVSSDLSLSLEPTDSKS